MCVCVCVGVCGCVCVSAFYASSRICEKLILVSSCLSACPHATTRHWTDFREILYWSLLLKPVEEESLLTKIELTYQALYLNA
jgi:hypothetical protein